MGKFDEIILMGKFEEIEFLGKLEKMMTFCGMFVE